jgi:hypothetical protein
LDSDVAHLEADGSGFLAPAAAGSGHVPLLRLLDGADVQLRGDVDLAGLAAMLPSTLRVREATQISSGHASLDVTALPQGNEQQLDGRLVIDNLAAVHEGHHVAWDQPVEAVVSARRAGASLRLERVTCRANFLDLTAQGELNAGSLRLEADLARFLAEASQFIDLGDVTLSGKVTAEAQWNAAPDGQLTLTSKAVAQGLEIVIPNCRPWREQELRVEAAAKGLVSVGRLEQLDEATARLEAGNDRLDVELLKAVAVNEATAWPLRVDGTGELADWLPRLQVFWPLTGWDLAGSADVEAVGELAPDRIVLTSANVAARDFSVRSEKVRINEPIAQLETSGTWDRARGRLDVGSTTVACTSLAMRAGGVQLDVSGEQPTLTGDASYRVQLDQVLSWIGNPQQPPMYRLSGEATGKVELARTGAITAATWTAVVKDWVCAKRVGNAGAAMTTASQTDAWHTVWQDPRLQAEGECRFDPATAALELPRCQLATEALGLEAEGRIRDPLGRCDLDLKGKLAYDLQTLVPLLAPQMAPQLQMVGRDTRPFAVRGPLFHVASTQDTEGGVITAASHRGAGPEPPVTNMAWDEITGQASVRWESANVAGFVVGPGLLDAQLAEGTLSVAPLELPVSGGRVRLSPRIALHESPTLLTHPAGSLAEQVRLTPEMCRGWLKYVAPLAANATSAEGQFSVSLDGASVPISSPTTGDARGVLTIHSAQVGPGPLAREFLPIAAQIKALLERRAPTSTSSGPGRWLDMPAQTVNFHMTQGRVFHEGLQIVVDDVVVRTRGSVGFDESLSLVAEVPIRDEWVANDRYLSALRGQVLQLPVEGTLERPRVDGGALAQLSRQAVTGAAGQLLQQELNRGLERLFGPQGR